MLSVGQRIISNCHCGMYTVERLVVDCHCGRLCGVLASCMLIHWRVCHARVLKEFTCKFPD